MAATSDSSPARTRSARTRVDVLEVHVDDALARSRGRRRRGHAPDQEVAGVQAPADACAASTRATSAPVSTSVPTCGCRARLRPCARDLVDLGQVAHERSHSPSPSSCAATRRHRPRPRRRTRRLRPRRGGAAALGPSARVARRRPRGARVARRPPRGAARGGRAGRAARRRRAAGSRPGRAPWRAAPVTPSRRGPARAGASGPSRGSRRRPMRWGRRPNGSSRRWGRRSAAWSPDPVLEGVD